MNKREAKKRIEQLKKTIKKYRYQYHVLDKEEISEEALDSLKKELFDLENEFPELITPPAPSARAGLFITMASTIGIASMCRFWESRSFGGSIAASMESLPYRF
jgi:NAD-dependent DNA ligase